MSVETYARYELSKAERARLERERELRLAEERRRQEEARKRQEEERRRKIISEQKDRVAYASDFDRVVMRLRKGVIEDRLTRARTLLAKVSDKKLYEKLSKTLQTLGSNAEDPAVQPDDLEPDVAALESELLQASTAVHAKERVFDEEGTRRLLDELKSSLPRISKWAPSRVDAIRKVIRDAEGDLPKNHSMHLGKLRDLELEVLSLGEQAIRNNKRQHGRLAQIHQTIEEWISRLRALHHCAAGEAQAIKAEDLATRFENIEWSCDALELSAAVKELESEALQLEKDIRQSDEDFEAFNTAITAVADSLEEMGYNVELMPISPSRSSIDSKILVHTPGNDYVIGTFGTDRSLHFQFEHHIERGADAIVPEKEELTERCRTWCKDQAELLARLADKGVLANNESAISPDNCEVEIPIRVVDRREERPSGHKPRLQKERRFRELKRPK